MIMFTQIRIIEMYHRIVAPGDESVLVYQSSDVSSKGTKSISSDHTCGSVSKSKPQGRGAVVDTIREKLDSRIFEYKPKTD